MSSFLLGIRIDESLSVEFLSRTYGQRSSWKCHEGIQCARPCRCVVLSLHLTVSLPEIPCISYLLKSLQSSESLACSDVSTDAEKLKAEASLEV